MIPSSAFPEQGTTEDQLLFVLQYAIRAPSTHNSQPWLFRINQNVLEIYADWTRKLPEGDKDGRDLCISLGACIEHATTALKYFGMFESLHLNPDVVINTKEPIAHITVHHAVGREQTFHPLVSAIEKRFNARGPFIKKNVDSEVLGGIKSLCEDGVSLQVFTEDSRIKAFADITGEGMCAAHHDPKFRKEIASWMNHNYSPKRDGIPGYSMLAPDLLSLVLPVLIGNFNMGGLLAKLNFRSITSSSGVLVFSSSDTPSSWVRVGMLFARSALFLNTHDIYTSIYVASIETPHLRRKLKEIFDIPSEPQFACSFGYPKYTLRQTPRLKPIERMLQ